MTNESIPLFVIYIEDKEMDREVQSYLLDCGFHWNGNVNLGYYDSTECYISNYQFEYEDWDSADNKNPEFISLNNKIVKGSKLYDCEKRYLVTFEELKRLLNPPPQVIFDVL